MNAPTVRASDPAGRPTHIIGIAMRKSESPECGVAQLVAWTSGDGSDGLLLDDDADRDRELPVRSLG